VIVIFALRIVGWTKNTSGFARVYISRSVIITFIGVVIIIIIIIIIVVVVVVVVVVVIDRSTTKYKNTDRWYTRVFFTRVYAAE